MAFTFALFKARGAWKSFYSFIVFKTYNLNLAICNKVLLLLAFSTLRLVD